MKYLFRKIYKSKIGIIDRMAPAMMTSRFVAFMYCFDKKFNPWVSIYFSVLEIKSNGLINSFQTAMKTNTHCVAIDAFILGKTMRKNVPSRDKPSIAAASSTSRGKCMKNCRIIKIYVILI